MTEKLPSDSGDYNEPHLESYVADFDAWEQELADEPRIAELSAELGRLTLADTVDYQAISDEQQVKEPEGPREPEEPKEPKEKDAREQYDSLNLDTDNSSPESGFHVTEDELFNAAMGLIYFTTGIPVEKVFEE